MSIKQEKSFFSLLILFFLTVISCQDPLGDNKPHSPEAIPAGKGSFSLTLDAARAIAPDTPSLNDFAVYNLSFTPVGSGSAENVDRTNETLSTDPIILAPGTYNLIVNAYKDIEKEQLAARGTLDDITISIGKNTAAAVTLKALLSEGAGTFNWEITLPAGVTAAMTVTPGNFSGTDQEIIPLTPSHTSGSRTLISGPYSLTFNLENTDGKSALWYELLYVYQNLESNFTFTFTDAHLNDLAYTVTYHFNNGVTNTQTQSVLHGAQVSMPTTPIKSGYAFAGWYADNDAFNDKWNFENPVIESLTLYARWIEKEDSNPNAVRELTVEMWSSVWGWNQNTSLRINVNGSNLPTNARLNSDRGPDYYYFDAHAGDIVQFFWVGSGYYDFQCAFAVYYRDDPPSPEFNPTSGTAVDSGRLLLRKYFGSTNIGNGTLMGSFTVTAGGGGNTPTINFDANGGSGEVSGPITVTAGSSVTLPGGGSLTRSDYLFGGWNTNALGIGTDYLAGSSFTPTGNTILYARWDTLLTENIWADGIITSTTSASCVWYSINVTSGTTYYLWWNDRKEGNSDKTLDVAVNAIYSDGSNIFTSADSGWTDPRQFTADRNGAVHVRVIPSTSGETGTFALVYSTNSAIPSSYTVSFSANSNYNSTVPPSQTVQPGSSIILPDGDGLTRNDYTFGGWNTTNDGTGDNYSAGETFTPTADTILYAKWLRNCSVRFIANGGSGEVPNSITVPEGTSIMLPDGNELEKSGYAFNGWNTKNDGTGTNYDAGEDFTVTDSTTLYARWLTTYIITFNANGGIGNVPSPITADVSSGTTLPSGDELSRSGYVFGGWNTSFWGTGTSYYPGESYRGTRTITLYARWDKLLTENIWTHDSITSTASSIWYSFNVTSGNTYYVWWNDREQGASDKTMDVRVVALAWYDDNYRTRIIDWVDSGWTNPQSFTASRSGTAHIYVERGYSGPTSGTFALVYSTGSARPAYSVSFDANGGSGTAPSPIIVQTAIITLPYGTGLSRSGYLFGGWNTNADGTGTNYSAGETFTPTVDTTLYARWLPLRTVTFNANSGTGTVPPAQTVLEGSSITLPNGGLTKSGYTFSGWNTNADGTGTNYSAEANFTVTASTTLYARWIINYTITFNANSGSGTVASITASNGSSITLPGRNNLTRSGYLFGGWNTNADGTGTDLYAGTPYTLTGNITLYARWDTLLTENRWADGSITSTASGVWYAFNVTSGTYYVWWNDQKQGYSDKTLDITVSAVYSNGSSIFTNIDSGYTSPQQFTAATSGTVHIRVVPYTSGSAGTFAIAYSASSTKPASYIVTFNRNDGLGTPPASQTVQPGSSITLPSGTGLIRSGYLFGGWNIMADGTGTNYNAGSSFAPTDHTVLYAKWNPTYTVTFNNNGGSGTVANRTVEAGSSITLPSGTGLTKSGYLFGCWNTNADGTGTDYNAGSSFTPSGNTTLYAKWNPAYTVTFNNNGGSGTVASQAVEVGSSTTLPDGTGLTKSGYLFGGWNTNADGTGTDYSVGSSFTPSGNTTLYVKWNPAYTVTFSNNGGNGTVASQAVLVGSSTTLPSGTGLSRSGYLFGGWNTSADGTGTNFSAGSSYTPSGNTTLYARWNPTYTVTFSINGGSGTVASQPPVLVGSSITLPSGTGLSRSGCTFDGWNTSADGTGTNFSAGSSYTPTGNITLYARWICTVTFNTNGGIGTPPASQTVTAGSTITLPDDNGLTRDNYIFNGWTTNNSGSGTNYNAGASYTVNGNITLYARWAYNNYTVTFSINGGTGTAPGLQTVVRGGSITLPDGYGLRQTGDYIFDGWNTNSSGTGTNYNPGASYTPTENTILYARWISGRQMNDQYWATVNNGAANGGEYLLSIDVISDRTYYIWWNDSGEGDGTKTLNIRVSAYYLSGETIFTDVNSGWNEPRSFRPNKNCVVRIKVQLPMTGGPGSFAVACINSSTRPP